ncbi:MAG: RibD family protein [Anaerolineales bacterium]|nr:RibD family protein [Anaerolineales bacterium]
MRRPFVTVTYAQSLNGSLAAAPGRPLALSGPQSLAFTHQLRAAHAAILVGVNTVLSDDPQLTVRHASGPNPQPIVLDSRLRCPLSARLLRHPTHTLWLATTEAAPAERQAALEAAGARVIRLPADSHGHVALPALLDWLGAQGVASLMVEGGAQTITAFLEQRLTDRLIVTLAPRLVGGLNAIAAPLDLTLHNVRCRMLGEDVIVEAEIDHRQTAV